MKKIVIEIEITKDFAAPFLEQAIKSQLAQIKGNQPALISSITVKTI